LRNIINHYKALSMKFGSKAMAKKLLLLMSAFAISSCGGGASNVTNSSTANSNTAIVFNGTAGDFDKTIAVGTASRRYLLHVPASYRSGSPIPAVLLFHGGQGSATTIANITGKDTFSAFADRAGFIAIYPNSVSGTWDDGRDTVPVATNDVAFVDALLDEVAKDYNVDTKRVYATGISNGGMMTHRLACDLTKRFAAVATVAANMPVSLSTKCSPTRAMPIALLSGDADPLMPYAGGSISGGISGNVLSVADTVKFWLNKNSLVTTAKTSLLADADTTDGTTTTLFEYGVAASSNDIALYSIKGGGHTWPSGTQYFTESLIGKVARDFSGNDAIWNFLSKHSLP
jgi:polyhydroxybutyrate depolymerase